MVGGIPTRGELCCGEGGGMWQGAEGTLQELKALPGRQSTRQGHLSPTATRTSVLPVI